MRLLICHNFYQQPGGEDQVFAAEVDLLRRNGHDVSTFEMDNDAVASMSMPAAFAATLWNRKVYRALAERILRDRPEVVHFHNTFPLISPAAYYAARRNGAAVVQTLHNFRLLCPGANLFRDGKPCESCVGHHVPLPGVVHRCYRDSGSATGAVAALLTAHRAIGTWRNAVDLYLVPTEFARGKFMAGGLPPEKLIVKPNHVDPDPGVGAGDGKYAVFVARLSREKGVETLLRAWEQLRGTIPLRIIGDGPLAPLVIEAAKKDSSIQWLGRRSLAEVYEAIGHAAALIFPSECYETFGRVAVEAYARGTPVIASGHGAPAEVVREGITGFHFAPGDAGALARQVREAFGEPGVLQRLRPAARREYEAKYTGAANHEMLMSAYRRAVSLPRTSSQECLRGQPVAE